MPGARPCALLVASPGEATARGPTSPRIQMPRPARRCHLATRAHGRRRQHPRSALPPSAAGSWPPTQGSRSAARWSPRCRRDRPSRRDAAPPSRCRAASRHAPTTTGGTRSRRCRPGSTRSSPAARATSSAVRAGTTRTPAAAHRRRRRRRGRAARLPVAARGCHHRPRRGRRRGTGRARDGARGAAAPHGRAERIGGRRRPTRPTIRDTTASSASRRASTWSSRSPAIAAAVPWAWQRAGRRRGHHPDVRARHGQSRRGDEGAGAARSRGGDGRPARRREGRDRAGARADVEGRASRGRVRPSADGGRRLRSAWARAGRSRAADSSRSTVWRLAPTRSSRRR